MNSCIRVSLLERRVAGLSDQAAAYPTQWFIFFLFTQRPKPQGGATVQQRERWPHAKSPELLHFKSAPQGFLPGRGDFQWGGGRNWAMRLNHQRELKIVFHREYLYSYEFPLEENRWMHNDLLVCFEFSIIIRTRSRQEYLKVKPQRGCKSLAKLLRLSRAMSFSLNLCRKCLRNVYLCFFEFFKPNSSFFY